uniref:Pepdidase_M14_N domain-containing protein n=1 Tax=Macrostomum lignano TaxID=282301 RepID=A0A1I8IL36_9PLAT
MDGSKIKNYFEALIKHHRNSANHSRVRLDDSGHGNIRTVISRLLQALQNQDKLNRDWLLRQPNYAQSLVLTLQSVPDRAVQLCSANCIAELLGHANTARRAQVFVKHGATMALCQSMAQEWRESAPNEAMLMLLHQILTKLAPKDKRLPARLRQHQCLPITLSLLRQCALASPGSGRQAHVPLALLKSACLSSQRNAAAAGRSGAIQQLLKLTEQCGRRQLTLLKLALDTLICLTRLRSNAARALGNGGLGLALAQFEDWQRRDNRNRNVPIRRALLLLLKQLTAVRAGRRALMELGGAEALYQLCRGSLGNAELEPLTSAATLILRQCAPRTRLPVPTPILAELNAAYGHLISQEAASQASPGPVSLPCLSKQSSGLASSASYLLNSSNMMASLEQSLTKSMRLSATDTSLLSVAAKPLTSRSQQQQQQQQRVSPWLSTTSDSSGVSILTERYVRLSNRVKSVARFQMLGYPDLIGATSPPYREALTERKSVCTQALVLEDARRWIDPSDIIDRVVYDLDDLIARSRSAASNTNRLINEDELELQQQQPPQQLNSHLTFESRFESGNLRRAIQVRRREYDLLLNPDIGHRGHLQWFYFRLSNCEAGVPYRFNIINCEKPGSQFTCGMRPLLFSVKEAMLGRAYWLRAGKDVCYYRNQYWRPKTANSGPRMPYYTASFTLTFKHSGDICYLAYYIPYTYTRLLADLEEWQSSGSDGGDILFSKQCLGNSLGGNQIHLVTVTAEPVDSNRPVVLITGRVHPGESNASWTVRGLGNYLVSPAARQLRREFIFKLVPMLNPDGVINGNHRCSLSAEDLNRAWLRPTVARQPEIYHT